MAELNTEFSDSNPLTAHDESFIIFFSADGRYLFYARGHRNEAGEVMSRNIYMWR